MAVLNIDWNPTRKVLRNFGLIGLVAFAAIGALVYWQVGPGRVVPEGSPATWTGYVLWLLGAYCGVCAVAAPSAVRPLYLFLSLVTYPIGFVLSYVVMAIMFYLVITPIGLVFKLLGRDPMGRKFDPTAATYWVVRRPPTDVKRYFRQF